MSSPFPVSSSAPGEGKLVAQLLPNLLSALSHITFQYPLKLISPSPSAHQKSVLVFLLTYGGGLIGGDQVNLQIKVQPNAKLSIVTQGHTKIFKSPSRSVVTRQKLDVDIEAGASLCILPDPVQPFDQSVYEQSQKFVLAEGASICVLDWISAGRTARGEDWDLRAWSGRNEVWSAASPPQKARMLVRDNVLLEGNTIGVQENGIRKKMQQLGIFGTLILKGPHVKALAAFFLAEFAKLPRIGARDFRSEAKMNSDSEKLLSGEELWRRHRLEQEKRDEILWSVAMVRGCTVVKFGARSVEGGRIWMGSMLKEEGSIHNHFGEDAMMCIR